MTVFSGSEVPAIGLASTNQTPQPAGTSAHCLSFRRPALAGKLLALLLAIHFTSALEAGPKADIPPFTAAGTVFTEVYQKPGDSPTSARHEQITFSYSNNWWRIEVKSESGFTHGIDSSLLEGNVVNCTRVSEGVQLMTRRKTSDRRAKNAWQPVSVDPITLPPPARNSMLVSWLALCPYPELPLLNDGKIRRLVSTPFLADPENTGTFFLSYSGPEAAFVSALCITNNGNVPLHTRGTRSLTPPFDQGHLELEFRVTESTNWNGLNFPLECTLRKYVPIPSGTELRTAVESRLTINSVHEGIGQSTAVADKVLAWDNRLASISPLGPLVYPVTNGLIPSATNEALLRYATDYNAAMMLRPPKQRRATPFRNPALVRLALMTVVLSPLVGLILYKIRSNKTKTNTKQL